MEHDSATKEQGSLWTLKPWWCQPWSIVLSGLFAITTSWQLTHRWWFTAPVGLGVVLWWYVFLVLVPAAHRQQMESGGSSDGLHESSTG